MNSVNVGQVERVASLFAAGVLAQRSLHAKGKWAALLGLGAAELLRRGVTGHCYARDFISRGNSSHSSHSNPVISYRAGEILEDVVTVNRPAAELYGFWRQLSNIPKFMNAVESVKEIDGKRSHWSLGGPGTLRLEWDAEIFQDLPDKVIAWRTLEGADIVSTGSVTFKPAPGDRGTEVKVKLQYDPPGGKPAALLARFLGNAPAKELRNDLLRFRQLMEAGEIVSTYGQPTARTA